MDTKVTNIVKDIKNFLEDKEKSLESLLIDGNKAEKLFVEIDFFVKEKLKNIFGEEKIINDKPCFTNLLSYQNKSNPYSDAVIYSFWSYRGESDIYSQEIAGDWRKNFFYKGTRWSNDFSKNKFYYFFKYFEVATSGKTTIEFFVDLGLKSKKEYFGLRTDDNILKIENDIIYLPSINNLKKINKNKLTELIDLIEEYKDLLTKDKTIFYSNLKDYNVDNFVKRYNIAFEEAKNEKFITDIINNISNYFNTNFEGTDENKKIIFGVIITLLFFDNPYTINFFLPNNNKEIKNRASLIITTDKNKVIENGDKDFFITLIDALKVQSLIERKILQKWQNLLPTYLRFKEKYNKIVDKYERLSEIAVSIVKAIAYKNNIKFTYELYRVKDFDSFFEKIIEIANGEKENNGDDDSRKTLFYEIINKVQTDKLEDICSHLSDIAGARIICLFQDETKIITENLNNLNEEGEIVIIDEKDYIQSETNNDPSKFGYRSLHRVFKLGEKRLQIYEFNDLKDIKCELQIRTLLADVWANASHQLFYKKKLPEKFNKISEIKSKFHAISGDLMNKDESLDEIKKSLINILKNL